MRIAKLVSASSIVVEQQQAAPISLLPLPLLLPLLSVLEERRREQNWRVVSKWRCQTLRINQLMSDIYPQPQSGVDDES